MVKTSVLLSCLSFKAVFDNPCVSDKTVQVGLYRRKVIPYPTRFLTLVSVFPVVPETRRYVQVGEEEGKFGEHFPPWAAGPGAVTGKSCCFLSADLLGWLL